MNNTDDADLPPDLLAQVQAEAATTWRATAAPIWCSNPSRFCAGDATTPELQAAARDTVVRVIELASVPRGAAARLGTACFPG